MVDRCESCPLWGGPGAVDMVAWGHPVSSPSFGPIAGSLAEAEPRLALMHSGLQLPHVSEASLVVPLTRVWKGCELKNLNLFFISSSSYLRLKNHRLTKCLMSKKTLLMSFFIKFAISYIYLCLVPWFHTFWGWYYLGLIKDTLGMILQDLVYHTKLESFGQFLDTFC